jgi:hypothetical protein
METAGNRPAEGGGREYVPAPPGNGLDEGEPLAQDGASITSGDVDNDGDVDLYIGCAWNHALGHGGNILLLNNGSGEFEDVTDDAGLRDRFSTTAACAFFDMDLDGDLDLVVMNSDFPGADKAGDGKTYLYRNTLAETGELLFVDETEERLDTRANVGAWAVVAPDLDMDGDPDLILTRDIEGLTQFYRNDGTGHFTDESSLMGSGSGDDAVPSTFGNDSRNAMGADVADTNNDGYIDLYISDIGTNALYLGNADGTVTERGRTSRVLGGTVSWGCAFADFDLDGWVDLHVAAGDFYDSYRESIRPFLYQNRGDGKFDEVASMFSSSARSGQAHRRTCTETPRTPGMPAGSRFACVETEDAPTCPPWERRFGCGRAMPMERSCPAWPSYGRSWPPAGGPARSPWHRLSDWGATPRPSTSKSPGPAPAA